MLARFAFEGLYAVVLGLSLGAVELLKANWTLPEPEPPPQAVAEFIAVPPKPEGAELPEAAEGAGTAYTEAACEALSGDYRDACFHALALQRAERDPDGGLSACAALRDPDMAQECAADVAELHSAVDPERAKGMCQDIPRKKWHDQCFFGIAMAWSTKDFDFARETCEEAGMWRDFCRHDVNGEIAQVDPEAALAWCLREEGTFLQNKGCYHGLGKYLGRVDADKALTICLQVPDAQPLYPQNCFHGLGWALSESAPDAALRFCGERAGAWDDSCRLGVSANTKRFDPARSVEICGHVRDPDLRRKCLKFAER
ncbi:MAG: hypothetical protein H6739_07335 [Alphaproteobacteria bacterium]|nr:hypothetical protein [Alphaproteobacteria bacterium]